MATHQIEQVRPASTTAFGQNSVNAYNGLEWRSEYVPRYHVYVYNCSARNFKDVGRIRLNIPGVNDDCSNEVGIGKADPQTGYPEKVKKGKENERWRLVTSFPQPMLIPKPDDQDGQIKTFETDARRFVVDIINPDNLGLSLNVIIPEDKKFSVGHDLSRSGVFYSLSNPPQEQDVREAYDRMEKYYEGLLNRARELELTDKAGLQRELGGNPDYGYAAEYFGEEQSWKPKPQRVTECVNCGGKKPAGRLFHMADFGLCVEPTEAAWKSVVKAGVRPYEAVPQELRWRHEEKLVASK